ncbi:hypothetical protein VOLCADRAFT_105164 [Volvox carteri f. nagariensis]|uniref:NAD(P)-binding domain-containing protein n=1 Tax=Volvox carteri f. nagariensis TaxID=3068 RepID=D8TYU4_VOLCA|nr:uncharacterized protein VOLCADRAFT_105164 [Volvox carteri f. nagariensis]EFJ47453.1 hypothetical protein VOLCADRAFT_105164 [Volvox carteri f. nagariensis]|eukprot:XP_002951642.1 hypothetical protein VOLCADRAFT_105164 [Volvox carteri f. nagariensis]
MYRKIRGCTVGTQASQPKQRIKKGALALSKTLPSLSVVCPRHLHPGRKPFTVPQRVTPIQPGKTHHHACSRQQHEQHLPGGHPTPPEVEGAAAAATRGARPRRRDVMLRLGLGPMLAVMLAGSGWDIWDGTAVRQYGGMRAWAAEGITTVFVAGSTGRTGRRVVEQLRRAGFLVRAGVRSPEKALALGFGADRGITIVEADVTKGGTINLVNAALGSGVNKFVLVSSLLTNAAAVGQATNLNYLFLNLFGGVLIQKLKDERPEPAAREKAAEKYLRASGLNYTIIRRLHSFVVRLPLPPNLRPWAYPGHLARPGGLSDQPEAAVGNLILAPEDTLFAGEGDPGRVISRDTVAEVAVQAIRQPGASRDLVLEAVASPTAPRIEPETWFSIRAVHGLPAGVITGRDDRKGLFDVMADVMGVPNQAERNEGSQRGGAKGGCVLHSDIE